MTKTVNEREIVLGILRVYEIQIPGKKRMETGAFLRGYAMEPGTLLG